MRFFPGTISFLFLFSLLTPLHANPLGSERISFKTQEGTPLVGFYKSPEKNNHVLVALHGLASSKEEWMMLVTKLDQFGWGWLIYDGRGQGESSLTKGKDNSPNGYRYFSRPGPGSEWDRMVNDLGAAMQFLDKKGIKKNQVVLAGASLGANICLRYAALTRFPSRVLLLSPGLDYQGVRTDDVVSTLKPSHVLLIAHPSDIYSFQSCLDLKRKVPALTFWTDVKAGHGVQMLDDQLLPRIIDWLGKK